MEVGFGPQSDFLCPGKDFSHVKNAWIQYIVQIQWHISLNSQWKLVSGVVELCDSTRQPSSMESENIIVKKPVGVWGFQYNLQNYIWALLYSSTVSLKYVLYFPNISDKDQGERRGKGHNETTLSNGIPKRNYFIFSPIYLLWFGKSEKGRKSLLQTAWIKLHASSILPTFECYISNHLQSSLHLDIPNN